MIAVLLLFFCMFLPIFTHFFIPYIRCKKALHSLSGTYIKHQRKEVTKQSVILSLSVILTTLFLGKPPGGSLPVLSVHSFAIN